MKKTVLVTGASGGIGSEICRIFAENGFDVAAQYNSGEKEIGLLKKELEERFGCSFLKIKADLSSPNGAEKAAEAALSAFKKIDVLVNNAGVSLQGVFQLVSEEDAKKVFSVNCESAMRLTQLILPEMIAQKHGKIVNISSMWGVEGGSCEVHYSASKAAIIGFTKALSKEVGPSGINVNCVAPGFIETKMTAVFGDEVKNEIAQEAALCRNGTPRDIAEPVFFLSSEKASFITGQVLVVDGGR